MKTIFRNSLCQTIYQKWMESCRKINADVILFYEEQEARRLPATLLGSNEVFDLDADAILGIGAEEGLIRNVAGMNPVFAENDIGLYEYACRLVSVSGECELVPVGIETIVGNIHSDELAMIYAYTIRLHMGELHKSGVMDVVFQKVCALMQEKGCFPVFQQYMNIFLSDSDQFEKIAGLTSPFLVLRGANAFGGILQQFADDLSEALIENGQAVIEIGENDSDYDRIQGMLIKGIVGFQTKALEIDFFKRISGPKFQFWFDNPLRFVDVLRNQSEDYYVLCQDADHAELIREYYHTMNAIQFPPGGRVQEFWEGERPIDIIFIGNYFPDDSECLQGEEREFYDYMKFHPRLTFEQGYLRMKDTTSEMVSIPQKMAELKRACRSVIGYFRNKVITTVLNAGIELHAYGDNWSVAPYHLDANLVIHPSVPLKDSLAEFRKAKIGLNIMSWYKSGMTERIANIMLSGAVCLTDETSYLCNHTVDGQDILLYHLEELEKLPEMIRQLLEDGKKRDRIAKQGYEKAMKEFSWNIRAKQLVTLAENYRML